MLEPQMVDCLESGCALIVATVSPEGEPCATRRVGPDRRGLAIRGNRRSHVRAAVARRRRPDGPGQPRGRGAPSPSPGPTSSPCSRSSSRVGPTIWSPPPTPTANAPTLLRRVLRRHRRVRRHGPAAARAHGARRPRRVHRGARRDVRPDARTRRRRGRRRGSIMNADQGVDLAARPAPVLRGRGPGGDRHRVGRRHARTSPTCRGCALVDDERVALSNQFFSKTARNLAENPRAEPAADRPDHLRRVPPRRSCTSAPSGAGRCSSGSATTSTRVAALHGHAGRVQAPRRRHLPGARTSSRSTGRASGESPEPVGRARRTATRPRPPTARPS